MLIFGGSKKNSSWEFGVESADGEPAGGEPEDGEGQLYSQYHPVLHKGFAHLRMLVSAGAPGTNPLQILWGSVCPTSQQTGDGGSCGGCWEVMESIELLHGRKERPRNLKSNLCGAVTSPLEFLNWFPVSIPLPRFLQGKRKEAQIRYCLSSLTAFCCCCCFLSVCFF